MRTTELVTLMDAEADRQEQANDHEAAILLRAGADALRSPTITVSVKPSPAFIVTVADALADQQRRGL